jgi:hypothetical protein
VNTKCFVLNNSKHSLNLICSCFHHEYNSDFFSVVTKDLNFATFSSDSLAILTFSFFSEFWWRDMTIFFVISALISRQTHTLGPEMVSVFYFMLFVLNLYHQLRVSVDMSHSIPNLLDFLALSWWLILRQNWGAMAIEHFPLSGHSE